MIRKAIEGLSDDTPVRPCFTDSYDEHSPGVQVDGFGYEVGFGEFLVYVSLTTPPSEYMDHDECVESGEHLQDCDDDGYCNLCGEQ
jgi:hypothetical protein